MANKKIGKFLHKLFSILDNQLYHPIISWDFNGQNVLIKDQYRLENQIIPEHFSLRKFASFIRQLHLYNFHKKKSKSDFLIFSNTYFLREHRQQALKVIRKRKTKCVRESGGQYKESEKTIETEQILQNEDSISEIQNKQYKIRSYRQLQEVALKSYSNLQEYLVEQYDILNIL